MSKHPLSILSSKIDHTVTYYELKIKIGRKERTITAKVEKGKVSESYYEDGKIVDLDQETKDLINDHIQLKYFNPSNMAAHRCM